MHLEPADIGDAEEEMEPFEVQDIEETSAPYDWECHGRTEAISMQKCMFGGLCGCGELEAAHRMPVSCSSSPADGQGELTTVHVRS